MSAFGVCLRCVRKQNVNWTLGIDRFYPKSGIIINIIFSCGETIGRSCFLSLLLAHWRQVVLYTFVTLEPLEIESWIAIKKYGKSGRQLLLKPSMRRGPCDNGQGYYYFSIVSLITLPWWPSSEKDKTKKRNRQTAVLNLFFASHFGATPRERGVLTRLTIKIWMDFSKLAADLDDDGCSHAPSHQRSVTRCRDRDPGGARKIL